MLGGKGFVSNAPYPKKDEGKIDKKALAQEEMLRNLIEDVKKIVEVTGKTQKNTPLPCTRVEANRIPVYSLRQNHKRSNERAIPKALLQGSRQTHAKEEGRASRRYTNTRRGV